jgi:hypothetical protein
MAATPYYYQITYGPRTRLRLLMNGVPFYRDVPKSVGVTHGGAANHLMVPGENVLTLDVLEADTFFSIVAEITVDFDHKSPVVRVDWPEIWKDLPAASQVVPFRHDARFRVTGVESEPAYLRAPKTEFGTEGTPELREAVWRYHDVTARGDTEAFLHEIELQLSEMNRAYDNHPAFAAGSVRSDMAERFDAGITARPLDFDELHFESFADGRVAYVTRVDGGPALQAASGNGQEMAADLWLTQENGQWRVFR